MKFSSPYLASMAVLFVVSQFEVVAQAPAPPVAPAPVAPASPAKPEAASAEYPPPPDGYLPVVLPDNIAPTAGTVNDPNAKVVVHGQPRMAKGHPCTLWDSQDIDRLKELLKTDATVQALFANMKKKMDVRITQPLDVPLCHKGPDGKWMWPQDFPANEAPHSKQSTNCVTNSEAMESLGILYVLTGDQKYADYCRQMFLAYAANYPYWGRSPKASWRSASDGRVSFQFLNDGFYLANYAWAYDLISNLPTLTKEDRASIHDNFFVPMISEFFIEGAAGNDYMSYDNNRSAICAGAVLIAGYATDDPEIVNFAMYGHNGSKLQPVFTPGIGPDVAKEVGNRPLKPGVQPPPGGFMGVHFSPGCLHNDGFWCEGSPGYSLGIAACGLFDDAEVLWRHGTDMYSYRNGVLKRLIDSAFLVAYPGDPKYPMPIIGDSGAFDLLDKRDWSSGEMGVPFTLGYQRYQNPQYLPVIYNAAPHLGLTVHSGPPLIKDNLPDPATVTAASTVVPIQNANFYDTGLGFMRVAEEGRINSLLMQYGSSWQGHDHPCKLGIDLYAFGGILMSLSGDIFPYNDPLDKEWYDTSLANCDLVVDMLNQLDDGNHFKLNAVYKLGGKAPSATSPQLVFAPAATMGMQRAYSSTESPGTTMDRSLFLTSRYMADVVGGFSSGSHTYDLAWHFLGTVATTLTLSPMTFPDPVPEGYSALTNIRHATTTEPWSATVSFKDKQLPFWTAADGTKPTDVIFADGHYNGHTDTPPTILVRRKENNTVYGSVMDLSGDAGGYVQGATQEGGLEQGYGLLQVKTAKGTDQCFTSFRPGSYETSTSLATDAQQAFVRMDGANVQALYLAGGKTLTVPGGSIARSEPGLAYVEKLTGGSYIVGNSSPSDATVTVTLPALKGLKASSIDRQDKSTGPATVTPGANDSMALVLKADSKVEFAP
jgi:hypothetical protein